MYSPAYSPVPREADGPTQGGHSPGPLRSHAARLRAFLSTKGALACVLLLSLALLFWRQEHAIALWRSHTVCPPTFQPLPPTLSEKPETPTPTPTPAAPTLAPDLTPTPLTPPTPIEVPPTELPRRARLLALNGDYPQYNEEKLTPVLEHRARPAVPDKITSIVSPSGRLRLTILLTNGRLAYTLEVGKPNSAGTYLPLIEPSFMWLQANSQTCSFDMKNSDGNEVAWQLESGESWWRPVPGNERRHFHQTYQQAKVWCVGPQCKVCNFLFEYRLYDHALAIRAVVNSKSTEAPTQSQSDTEYVPLEYALQAKLPSEKEVNAACWAQSWENEYLNRTCGDVHQHPGLMLPLTVELEPRRANELPAGTKPPVLPYRYLALLQADGFSSTQALVRSASKEPSRLTIRTQGDLPTRTLTDHLSVIEHPIMGWATATSWNVILVGDSPEELVHHNSIVYLLCPPPSPKFPMAMDGRWVAHGKSLRSHGFSTGKSKQLIDFAAESNYQQIHIDAGWYGHEYNQTSDPRAVYPAFKDRLDMKALAAYARERGIDTSVYVNDYALKYTPELLDIYSEWDLRGVKFGFVVIVRPREMRLMNERLIAYQEAGIAVNIHDYYRPRGLARTWPHLITQEGVRGDEHMPNATHHTILPFVRLLQGAADYTPRYLNYNERVMRSTRAHQLALPFVLFSPLQSLYWNEPNDHIMEAGKATQLMPEQIIWQVMPTTWDDTRVLAASIGEYASFARRSGEDWFIGTITNTQPRTLTLNLSQLFDHSLDGASHPLPLTEQPLTNAKGYMVLFYEDDHGAIDKLNSTIEANRNKAAVRLQQRFILPAAFSTEVHHATKVIGLEAHAPFPSDPPAMHITQQQEQRRKMIASHETVLKRAFHKKTGSDAVPKAKVLDSPMFKVQLSPSGGCVLFITPIL